MASGFEIQDDGTSTEVDVSKNTLDSNKAFCVVDDSTNSIFLWKGRLTNVRKKFAGATVASNLRAEFGHHFKVLPEEEGEESNAFLSALG
jgi:hypothetical protein